MSLTATDASSLGLSIIELQKTASDQLKIIDEKIKMVTPSLGTNLFEYILPTSFSLKCIISASQLNQAKKYIYGTIVDSLQQRGFRVKLLIKEKSNILFITWESNFDKAEIDKFTDILKNVVLNEDEANEYKRSILS